VADPFHFNDYKDFLKAVVHAEGAKRGLQGALAEAAGCKSSYLSQVLSGPVHLTPDHAIGIAEHLGLTEIESDYLLALLHEGRAATPRLKKKLEAQRAALRKRRDDLAARFAGARPPAALPEAVTRYYSHWRYAVAHLMLGIPGLDTPQALAPRLGLSVRKTQEMLESLAAMKLAATSGGKWQPLQNDLHLPKGSPLANVTHVNWRMRSVQRLQDEADADDLVYSGIHTLSRGDVDKIKGIMRDALERARAVIAPSPEEEVICLLVDCFVV
jgi:uncharacterized protein (TIGR02147 family)